MVWPRIAHHTRNAVRVSADTLIPSIALRRRRVVVVVMVTPPADSLADQLTTRLTPWSTRYRVKDWRSGPVSQRRASVPRVCSNTTVNQMWLSYPLVGLLREEG